MTSILVSDGYGAYQAWGNVRQTSHVSKIENGAVDLRVSSLAELARALDLELTLVRRKTVPAVRSITRADVGRPFPADESARAAYSLEEDDDG